MVDVVTGGGGFIGSHLVDRLLQEGRTVRVLDNFEVGRRANLDGVKHHPHLGIVVADVTDMGAVDEVCQGAERIFHLAARADIVPSINEPEAYFSTNVDGTFAMLMAARRRGIARFVYAASSSCYGIPDIYPTPETAPLDPRYPYALTKRLGEELVLHWAQLYSLPAISLRLFNVYGPRARTSGTYGAVFGVFLAQILAGKPLTIVGDGTQTRDFTYVGDVVDALMLAGMRELRSNCYNVGTGRPVSVNRLVELLGARETVRIPKRPGEPDCTWADSTRFQRDFGWAPRTSFEEGVKIMLANIEYWRDAPVWTADKIASATVDWFKYLSGRETKSDVPNPEFRHA